MIAMIQENIYYTVSALTANDLATHGIDLFLQEYSNLRA